jgi:transcriptional regulator with XRE-family HTH domain
MESFGARFRRYRKLRKQTMVQFCRKAEIDQGYWSRVEQGKLKPPTREVLKRAVEALGMRRQTQEEVYAAAAIQRLQLPPSFLDNPALVKVLPELLGALSTAGWQEVGQVMRILGAKYEYDQSVEDEFDQTVRVCD